MVIKNISDTARWVAAYRAMETERPDALFRDPYAARLAGDRGAAIVDALPRGRQMAWSMIVRTALFDEIILERVGAGVDLVLNLAAGLDARPWRLALPPALRWVDVDLPEILAYKAEVLRDATPVCRYEGLDAELTGAGQRQAVFAQLGASATRAIVVTEGLLVYLAPEQVASLARDLHAAPSFRWWLLDLASPRLLVMMSRMWAKSLNAANAPFRFAPAEGTGFFRPFGWREKAFRSTFEEAHRLGREMRMAWLWRLLARLSSGPRREEFRKLSGAVLLERE